MGHLYIYISPNFIETCHCSVFVRAPSLANCSGRFWVPRATGWAERLSSATAGVHGGFISKGGLSFKWPLKDWGYGILRHWTVFSRKQFSDIERMGHKNPNRACTFNRKSCWDPKKRTDQQCTSSTTSERGIEKNPPKTLHPYMKRIRTYSSSLSIFTFHSISIPQNGNGFVHPICPIWWCLRHPIYWWFRWLYHVTSTFIVDKSLIIQYSISIHIHSIKIN